MAKTIAGRILRSIFDLFKSNYPNWIKKTYQKIPDEIKSDINVFIQIADRINDAIQSNVTDIVTAIIPGDLDDKLVDWLRVVLPMYIDVTKEYTGGDKALLVANLTKDDLETTLDQALITSQVVYRESRPA